MHRSKLKKTKYYIKSIAIDVSYCKRKFDNNKTFWQRIKPHSLINRNPCKVISVVENDVITSDKKEEAEKLNELFIEDVENLDIETYLAENMDETIPETLEEIMD